MVEVYMMYTVIHRTYTETCLKVQQDSSPIPLNQMHASLLPKLKAGCRRLRGNKSASIQHGHEPGCMPARPGPSIVRLRNAEVTLPRSQIVTQCRPTQIHRLKPNPILIPVTKCEDEQVTVNHYKSMQSLLTVMQIFCAGLMDLAATAKNLAEVIYFVAPCLLQKSTFC